MLAEVNSFYKKARPNTGMPGVKILHDNTPANESEPLQKFLTEENVESLPQPAYFTYLASCNFFLVPHTKNALMEEH